MPKAEPRSTIEVRPLIRKALNVIARRRKRKVKTVSEVLLLFAIPHEKRLFNQPNTHAKSKTKTS